MDLKKLLKLEFLTQSSVGAAEGLGESFFSIIATRMGASAFIIALIGSSAYLSNLLSPLWAKISRKTGVKWLVIAGLGAAAFFLFSSSLFYDPLIFLIFVLLYYVGYGIKEVLYPALVQKVYNNISVLAHAEVVYTIAYTAAAILAGYIMYIWSYKIAFALATFLLIVTIFSRLPFPNPRGEENRGSLKNIRRDKLITTMVSTFMVAGTGMLMMLPAIPMLEVDMLKLSNMQIGIAIAVNSISYVFFAELWGRNIRKAEHIVRFFQIGFLGIAGMAVIYFMSAAYWHIIVANVLCGLGGSAISIGWQSFSMAVPEYRTEDLSALHLTTCGIRGLYAPSIGAMIISMVNLRATFLISLVFILVGIVIAEMAMKNLRESILI